MRRITTIGLALVASLAIATVAAAQASATKLTLSDKTGASLPLNEFFNLFGENNLVINASVEEGEIGCQEPYAAGVELAVLTNEKSTDELKVLTATGALHGGAVCRSFGGNATVSLNSGPIKLRANGKATWSAVSVSISFNNIGRCSFSVGHLTGTNNATLSRQPLEASFEHKLRLSEEERLEGAHERCPKSINMSVALDLTQDEEIGGSIYEQV
jgi:hypothetical protein